MDNKLREEFFCSMACFKKLESVFSLECEMQLNEMAILHNISGGCSCSEKSCTNLDVPRMQEQLRISKPAVSYILNTLEKKKYITRTIDPKDRRKISISTTPEGQAMAESSLEKCEETWSRLLEEFGEDNMRELIRLLNELNDLFCTFDKQEK